MSKNISTSYYQICYCFDKNYTTGNFPPGIFIVNNKKYTDIEEVEEVEKDFNKYIQDRKKDSEYEYGWELEYRLSILFIKNENKSLYKSDYDDDFWYEQLNK